MPADPSPQRYLANHINAVRTATVFTPSSVQSISNQVQQIPTARNGSAQVTISGPYSGVAEATYDIEIVDATITVPVISKPIVSGEGSATLSAITASAPAQEWTVTLTSAGQSLLFAGVDLEGAILQSRVGGATGNLLRLHIDQAAIVRTAQPFSLLHDLPIGAGSDSAPMEGPEFDYDAAVLGADGLIPPTSTAIAPDALNQAHRISFGDDPSIYLQYKQYKDGKWLYYLAPELKRAAAAGTVISYVTGGRTVTVTNGTTTDTFVSIVTLYDLLAKLNATGSTLIQATGVVANDRTPKGQAAHELQTRTDAHVEPSYGTGSAVCKGFVNTSCTSIAGTQLVIATCKANTRVGQEQWQLTSSLLGNLGVITTGQLFSNAYFTLKVPVVLPFNFGTQHANFYVQSIDFISRSGSDPDPTDTVCPVGLALGPNAIDGTVTLTWTKRPSGNCLCAGMPIPNLDTFCLGNDGGEGEGAMDSADIARMVVLRDWYADTVRANSAAWQKAFTPALPFSFGQLTVDQAPFVMTAAAPTGTATTGSIPSVTGFNPQPLTALVSYFQGVLTQIDALPAGALRTAGIAAWDTAIAEMQDDVDNNSRNLQTKATYNASEALTAGNAVAIWRNEAGALKVRKAVPGGERYGYVIADVASGAAATVYFFGTNAHVSGLVRGSFYVPLVDGTGGWTVITANGSEFYSVALSTTELNVLPGPISALYLAFLSDRYAARADWALMSAGILPKADASTAGSGDGCWLDWGGDFFDVRGPNGKYGPLFPNHKYWSVQRPNDQSPYYATHEFGLQVNDKCISRLKYGDKITLVIGNAGNASTYQLDDQCILPIIAGSDLYLAGGQDASLVQKWSVNGAVSGARPVYSYDPGAPAAYVDGTLLGFLLNPGGIPCVEGFSFRFSVEGGHWRWRKNAGAWSGSIDVPAGTVALDSGLSIAFATGAAPSFAALDRFSFRALQPWAVSNLISPDKARWQWTGSSANVVIDFGSPKTIDGLAIALHTLPAGATITLEGGNSAGVYLWTETPTWQTGVIGLAFATAHPARYLRLSVANATGGGIGWFWAGQMLRTSLSANTTPRRSYKMSRASAAMNGAAVYLGKAMSADVVWTAGAWSETDLTAFAALIDWIKTQNDEAFVFMPQASRSNEAYLVRIVTDDIDTPEEWDMNPDASTQRRFSARLPLQGFYN